MTLTFLVELNLSDVSDLIGVAGDIEEDLNKNFDVVSVKPWARPTSSPLTTLTETPPVQQP